MSLTNSPTKRQQVVNEIVENIRRGILEPGARLATVRDMSAHFDVSLSVIQNAMRELMDNGFVECRGASGFYVRTDLSGGNKRNKIQKDTDDRIYLSALHHSDLVWRHSYEEYDTIREEQIQNLLRLAEKYSQFHFGIEQAEILRVHLRKHPEDLARFQKLRQEGRFEYFGGLCIPDLNLVSGESIVRNLLLGRNFYREVFGDVPEIACMTDAFGMCAQLPQILVKCGFRYLLPGRMANCPRSIPSNGPFFWRGPDGTGITAAHSAAEITHLGYAGNVPVLRDYENQLARSVASLKYLEGSALVHYVTEEGRIEEDLFWIIETVNRAPGRLVEFGSTRAYFQQIAEDSLPVFHGEFNPTFTGCYTTRISVKQAIRKAENLLISAEIMDVLSGGKEDRETLWNDLISAQFHDAACGCHTDAANREIMRKLDRVIRTADRAFDIPRGPDFSVCSFGSAGGLRLVSGAVAPEGVPAQADGGKTYFTVELPACGARNFRAARGKPSSPKPCTPRFRTDFYEADFSEPFPVIRTLRGENVFARENFGEILIRSDYGTMWTEKFMDYYQGREFQREKVVEITEGEVFFKAVTEGVVLPKQPDAGNLGSHWPGFGSLTFRKEYLFPKCLDYFLLKLSLDWTGCNTKISIRFPLDLKMAYAAETYAVPFGCTVRKPYFEVRQENEGFMKKLESDADYVSARGDWPALNWVNYSDHRKGLTLANAGTPGHQLVNGEILVSLLRSGTDIKDGCMVPQEGSYENGHHEYEFAFRAHSPLEMGKAVELGEILNRPPRVASPVIREGPLLEWDAPNLVLSGMHRFRSGFLVRFYESAGSATAASMRKADFVSAVFETGFSGADPVRVSESRIAFRPFEIRTFYCTIS